MRRFTEPSEGDSIFNHERDMREKKIRLGQVRMRKPEDLVEVGKETLTPMHFNLKRFSAKPDAFIKDTKRFD